jgi:hypothetical protein
MRTYGDDLNIPTSTLDEFEYFLNLQGKGKETTYDPTRALFDAVHKDTVSLTDIIRISLRRVREGTLDEDLMQNRVYYWRTLLNQLNLSLSKLDQQLRGFTHFLTETEI